MANISFGKPGQIRKSFKDAKMEIQGGLYFRSPCPLVAGFTPADIQDGRILTPTTGGVFTVAADASRSLYMLFTSNSEVIIKEVLSTDEFPGADLSTTPTGLTGTIQAIMPIGLLYTGTRGAATVNAASYTVGAALTVVDGKLALANPGTVTTDRVVGYVEADTSYSGAANSVQVKVTL